MKYHSSEELREDMYYNIINLPEYATLKEREQQVIEGGLKRTLCIAKGVMINMPSDVPGLCQDYSLM